MTIRTISDKGAMVLIAGALSGITWTPDTLDTIADIVRLTGREIAESGELRMSLDIGDTSRNGRYQITDKRWDYNGTLQVDVRITTEQPFLTDSDIRAMRATARRALAMPQKTKSARLVRRWYANGIHATFAVSRLPR